MTSALLRRAVLLAVVALLLPAARARAAAVTVTAPSGSVEQEYHVEPYWFVSATVLLAGGPEGDDISFSRPAEGTVEIHDATAALTATGSCSAVDSNTVRCTPFRDAPPPPAGIAFSKYSLGVQVGLGAGDDRFVLGGTGTEFGYGSLPPGVRVDGGAGDDRITAEGMVSGGEGADVIIGDGNLQGGPGDDTIRDIPLTVFSLGYGGTIDGGSGDDVLQGNGRDELSYADRTAPVAVDLAAGTGGEAGEHDTVTGFTSVQGGHAGDVILGSAKDEHLEGGEGNDVIDGRDGPDRIGGGAGDDVVSGGAGNDIMAGFAGTDVLRGGPGNDDLYDSGGERDVLDGGPGADVLDGGPGLDRMAGGEGNDALTLGAASPQDTSCGAGRDRALIAFAGALVPDDCERLGLDNENPYSDLTVAARPLVGSRSVSLRVPAVCSVVGCQARLTVLVGGRVVGRGHASLPRDGVRRVGVRVSRAGGGIFRRARVLTLRLRFTGSTFLVRFPLEWRVRRRHAQRLQTRARERVLAAMGT